MPLHLFAAWFISLSLLIVALSRLLAPRAWVAFFTPILPRPDAGLIIAMFTLPVGLLGVIAHNDWTPSPGLIVILIAWGWTLKATLYMLAPTLVARAARTHMHARRFAIAGGVFAMLGAASVVHLVRV